ncbi:MAG: aminotransferase class I/II-fold pyridoxal phosphate-dependent enzyme, partial [Chloroflexi bacterium]|nr:aminotransferase class I/II-fold pyridoxal phosphate-dependent enzyme [Chloroflexota bacterium]
YLELPDFYQEKRDLFLRLMEGSRFALAPSAGTYFQLAEYGAISDEPDVEFARRLTTDHGVAVIPVSVFYKQPPEMRYIRFCFAKESATLVEAAERLSSL